MQRVLVIIHLSILNIQQISLNVNRYDLCLVSCRGFLSVVAVVVVIVTFRWSIFSLLYNFLRTSQISEWFHKYETIALELWCFVCLPYNVWERFRVHEKQERWRAILPICGSCSSDKLSSKNLDRYPPIDTSICHGFIWP